MYQSTKLIGNLGKDPDARYTPSGQLVVSFPMATSHSYKKDEEWHTETTWWKITVWGQRGEACQNRLQKGSRVFVEGRITVDKETHNPRVFQLKDGTWASSLELTANTVIFLDKKQKDDSDEDQNPF